MKSNLQIPACLCVATLMLPACAARDAGPVVPDLEAVPQAKGWKGNVALAKLVEKDKAPAVEFVMGEDANVVWLDAFEFTSGIIEFDAKGRSAPPQGSFIGVAFHVLDARTYDAVYFRPFNFRAEDPERRSHAVQYISEPEWPWQRLREEKTDQYEKALEPAPDGDAWFHAKVVVEKPKVSVYVNGATEPNLVVNELADRAGGSVGIWCNSYGVIANLTITPKKKP